MSVQMASAAGGSIERVSLLGELRAIAAAGGKLQSDYAAWEALKVDGGSSVLVDTLERELAGTDPVGRAGGCDRRGPALRGDARRRRAAESGAVVCCVPVGPLRAIEISGLSEPRLQSLRRQRQIRAAKAVVALDEPVWRRVECNGLIESEHETGGFWIQGENTLSSLLGPEHIGYLEAAPDGVATAGLLASLERVVGPVTPVATLWRHWGMDPYTLGYVSHWAPGDLTAVGPLHATHEPPFYLAGSDHWACGIHGGRGGHRPRGGARRARRRGVPLYPAAAGAPSASVGNFDTGYTSTGAERCCTSTPPSTRSVTPVM